MPTEEVKALRTALRPVGFSMPSIGLAVTPPVTQQLDAVRRLEAAGWRNGWANEGVGGKDVFVQLAILLAATDQMTFGTSVTPMWARPPMVAHAASHQLAEAFPGRFLLGLGSGYDFMATMVGLEYGKPLAALREYVARMTEPTPIVDSPPVNYATVLAANGRKSVAQAGQIADGVFPTMIPPTYTEEIRAIIGADKLLVVGLTTFANDDERAAKAAAVQTISMVFSQTDSPYARALGTLGYSERELTTAADRLIDDITGYGSAASIAAAARRHLDAGADHVVLQSVTSTFAEGVDQLEAIAGELTAVDR